MAERKVIDSTEDRGIRIQLIAKRLSDGGEVYDVELVLLDGCNRIIQYEADDLDDATMVFRHGARFLEAREVHNIAGR